MINEQPPTQSIEHITYEDLTPNNILLFTFPVYTKLFSREPKYSDEGSIYRTIYSLQAGDGLHLLQERIFKEIVYNHKNVKIVKTFGGIITEDDLYQKQYWPTSMLLHKLYYVAKETDEGTKVLHCNCICRRCKNKQLRKKTTDIQKNQLFIIQQIFMQKQ